ncbi:hypothetical protein BYT27DRAFT_7231872 [Phlegmacium glaucopus]|nr:hypothetical protein BYT27DRAFT_7231872 [Phlegmacium glaucopus]
MEYEINESRSGDYISRQATLALLVVTWVIVLMNDPASFGWFAIHPPLQTLAMFLFTFGILTLQPTARLKTKNAGLVRHQIVILVLGFPSILFGTLAMYYNKWLKNRDHFTTWHGTIGIICVAWLLLQIILGAGSVWFGGALFGGGMKAKSLWKYHRLSGYLLFPCLLYTVHLGGAWSDWGTKYSIWLARFLAYTLSPAVILVALYRRIRLSKMQFTK